MLPVRWSAIWLPGLSAPWLATWIPVVSFSECLFVIGIHTSGKRKIFAIIYLFCLKYATDQMRDRLPPTNRVVLLKLCLLPKWNWRSESLCMVYNLFYDLFQVLGYSLTFLGDCLTASSSYHESKDDVTSAALDMMHHIIRWDRSVWKLAHVEVKKNYWDWRYFYFYLFFAVVEQMST